MAQRPKTYQNYVPPSTGKAYQITANADGTSKITDVTNYVTEGDRWGAEDANAVWDVLTGGGSGNGALSVADGGTGQTSLAAARGAMGLGKTTGLLAEEYGGTGWNNMQGAVHRAFTNTTDPSSVMSFAAFNNLASPVKLNAEYMLVALGITRGNWSPDLTVTGGTVTMTPSAGYSAVKAGRYLKIGRWVLASFYIANYAVTVSAEQLRSYVSGLPFAATTARSPLYSGFWSVAYNLFDASKVSQLTIDVSAGSTQIQPHFNYGANYGWFQSCDRFIFSGTVIYETDS